MDPYAPAARNAEFPIDTWPAVPVRIFKPIAPIPANRQLLNVNRLVEELPEDPIVVKYRVKAPNAIIISQVAGRW
jgi:hypothetical protein